jgi:hypothetical protein
MLIDSLRKFYELWCKTQNLGLASTEDLLATDDLTDEQRAWLMAFEPLWDLTQEADDRLAIELRAPDPDTGPE